MIVTILIVLAGLVLGAALAGPVLRRGPWPYLCGVAGLYVVHFGILVMRGFEGLPLNESLLLFEGSTVAYLAFNAQVAWRAFAAPLLALSVALLVMMRRKST